MIDALLQLGVRHSLRVSLQQLLSRGRLAHLSYVPPKTSTSLSVDAGALFPIITLSGSGCTPLKVVSEEHLYLDPPTSNLRNITQMTKKLEIEIALSHYLQQCRYG
jgi:hypothetical protein